MLAEDKTYQSGLLVDDKENEPLNIHHPLALNESDKAASDIDTIDNEEIEQALLMQQQIIKLDNDSIIDMPSPVINKLIENEGDEDTDTRVIETTSTLRFRFYSILNLLDEKDKKYTSYIQQLEFGCLFEML